jgi:HK97 family phage portal protein
MGFLNLSKQSPPKQTKHPTYGNGDEVAYIQGSGKPTSITNISAYQNSVERLDTAIRTLVDIASPAKHIFYRKDAKGKLSKIKAPVQFNEEFTNDYQSYVDFNTSLLAAMVRYNASLIVPETSKNKYRRGVVDLFVMNNDQWYINTGSGNASIDSFTYRTKKGTEIKWAYDDIIYIVRSYDVSNPLYGIPKVTSLNKLLNMEINTTNWADSFTAQGGKKSLIVASDEWMSEENRKKITSSLREYLSATEAKVLAINTSNVTVTPTSDGLGSNQIVELMAFINNSITESFRIPPELFGKDLRSISDKTLRLAAQICYKLNVAPMLTSIEAHISRYIQNVMGLKNVYFGFDRESIDIFDESDGERVTNTTELLKYGIISPDEARMKVGLEPTNVKAMQEIYPPAFVIGSGGVSYQELNSVPPADRPTDVPSGSGGDNNSENLNGSA